jgi:hypothetical protein
MTDAEAEINAIEAIYKVMKSMDRQAQKRVLWWLDSRLEGDLRKRVSAPTSTGEPK